MSEMAPRWMLYPLLAMVLLSAVVACVLYRRRAVEMRARRVRPQAVASARQMSTLLEDTGPADNFRNLFETPVLFYLAALVVYVAALTNVWYLALAWGYVATRVAHSAIHCGYNKVMHRFAAFAASFLLLMILWASIAWDLLVAGRG